MTKEENKKIGKRVKLARELAGYKTKRKLADKLDGISEQVIKNIESGTTELKVDLAIKMKNLCQVSLDYLYNLTDYTDADENKLDKMLDVVFDIKIFNKEYTDRHLQVHNIETLQFKTKPVFIKYLFDIVKLK
ncbi:MAG: helix-turn-helix transcriptional regulator [Bacilli bacterium]|nr:helix-turn-helix transcriptional regulator [Bacilli bacterium]